MSQQNEARMLKYGLRPALPIYHDHQASGQFGECERMAYFSHVLGRRFVGRSTYALSWGQAFHRVTEIWETTQNIDEVHKYILGSLEENAEDKYGRTQDRMFEAFLTWAKYTADHPMKTLRTEQPTVIRCDKPCVYYPDDPHGCNLQYGGIMDRIVEWQGMVGPKDYKTTVMTDKDPVSEFRLSHQMRGYVWIASHLMGDHCWGAIIERIITNKSKIDISRFPVSYSRDLIREFVKNERRLQERFKRRFAEHAYDMDEWVQNFARCWEPYPCAWRDVCLASDSFDFRLKYLRDNTEEKRWDFMNRDAAPEVASAN